MIANHISTSDTSISPDISLGRRKSHRREAMCCYTSYEKSNVKIIVLLWMVKNHLNHPVLSAISLAKSRPTRNFAIRRKYPIMAFLSSNSIAVMEMTLYPSFIS